jgi:glycerophosphoryl diester phosphodiesterase
MNIKTLFHLLLPFVLAFTGGSALVEPKYAPALTRADSLIAILKNPEDPYVMVAVHRGDWRNYPENSLQAIQSSIDMGADIVEIDLQETKDGHLVLMHDKTIDRTSTGKGKVADFTLAELKQFQLKSGMGRPTGQRIPTLEEAMNLAKGKILVNLDKGYDHSEKAYEVLRKTGTVDHAIFKGKHPHAKVAADLKKIIDEIFFMPIVSLDQPDAEQIIDAYLSKQNKPVAFELLFITERSSILNKLNEFRKRGSRVWVNTLWDELCAGRTDDKAVNNIGGSYGWFVDKGVNIIQTDRPRLLLEYLKERNLH